MIRPQKANRTQVGADVIFSRNCQVTGREYRVTVPAVKVVQWERGELIQNVFPEMDSDQREFIMTGYTPDEWKAIFPPDAKEY